VKSQVKMLLSLPLILVSSETLAEIHKWLDRHGGIVYSQSRPPAGATTLKAPEIIYPPDDNGAASKALQEIINSEKEARNRRLARQQQNKDDQEKIAVQKEMQQSCKRSRKNLEVIKSKGHVYTMDSGGNKRFLNPKELSLKTQEAKEIINNYCPE
jgi:uncharacterized protein (DUF779 family)